VLKHALRNSLIPILTIMATVLPYLIGGSIIIEQIFTIEGMGQLMWESVLRRDYAIVMAITFVVAVLTMVGILLSDISYALADPRISYE
ncbi:MAG: ABC transporter permease subunit, partial [Planctomycetota bacterium]|jgi:peptide/nickel transport system permease protein